MNYHLASIASRSAKGLDRLQISEEVGLGLETLELVMGSDAYKALEEDFRRARGDDVGDYVGIKNV